MNKLFLVTPNAHYNGYVYPWFAWAKNIAEAQAQFEDCEIEEVEA